MGVKQGGRVGIDLTTVSVRSSCTLHLEGPFCEPVGIPVSQDLLPEGGKDENSSSDFCFPQSKVSCET